MAFGILYGCLLAALAGLRASHFQVVHGPDLAFYTQLAWSIAHGHGFWQTVLVQEHRGLLELTHLLPGLALLAPLQWVWPGAASLVAGQGLLWGLTTIPLHRIATRATGHRLWGAAVALLFAVHPLGIRIALADFRPSIVAVPLMIWTLERLQARRPGAAALLAVLACSLREDVVLSLALLGPVAFMLTPRRGLTDAAWSFGLPTSVGLLWSAGGNMLRGSLSRFVDPQQLQRIQELGPLPPNLTADLGAFLQPLPLTALLSPATLLPALPNLLGAYWMFRDGQAMDVAATDTRLHYVAIYVPLVVLASGLGAARLLRWLGRDHTRPRRILAGIVVLGSVLSLPPHGPRSALPWLPGDLAGVTALATEVLPQRTRDAAEIRARIPADEVVLADMHRVHLHAARPWLHWFDPARVPLYTRSWSQRAGTAVLPPAEAERLSAQQPGWHECWRGAELVLLQRDRAGAPAACQR